MERPEAKKTLDQLLLKKFAERQHALAKEKAKKLRSGNPAVRASAK